MYFLLYNDNGNQEMPFCFVKNKRKRKKAFFMMKKIASAAAACLMLGALAAQVNAVESPKVLTIPKVADGAINLTDNAAKDALYDLCEPQAMTEQNLEYFAGNPCDATGTFWAVCDSKFVYIYVDVQDANIDYSNENPEQTWNRESVGVMFDFDYIREEQYEYSYADNGDRICYLNFAGDFIAVTYHMYAEDADTGLYKDLYYYSIPDTGDGHILYEMRLPVPEDFDMKEGAKFGMEVIGTNAADGSRAGCFSWSPEGSEMWHYTDVCGTAIVGAMAEAPAEEAAAEDIAAAPAEAAAEPDAAPAAAKAPKTADTTAAAAAFAGISALVVLALSKKRK